MRNLNILVNSVLLVLDFISSPVRSNPVANSACSLLRQELPALVHFPGSQRYDQDIFHFVQTSTQNSTCSVEPSSVQDVQAIIQIVGHKDIRSPFAVKGGGHTFNQGFSSTNGVQISLSSFQQFSYDQASHTVVVGAGLTWDEIYARLSPYNVTVVGGRIAGVGLGLLLGGGYSWITDQYGLGIDNIVSMDIVLPDGTFVKASEKSRPELFFGLKGGINNFGIVTAFTLKTYSIGSVWAGTITYSTDQQSQVIQALADFSLRNTDHKAQLVGLYLRSGKATLWEIIFFYDGTNPTVFQPFLDIPSTSKNVGITEFNTFVAGSAFPPAIGGTFHTVPIVKYTVPLLKSIVKECDRAYSKALEDHRSLTELYFLVEPFANAFGHSTPSAYPHHPDRQVTPSSLWLVFNKTTDAEYFHDATWALSNAVQKSAIREGQSRWDDVRYPAYAIGDTPLDQLFGENLAALRKLKKSIDPQDVMSLTGGFKL